MRGINVGNQKRTKKKGAITRAELMERDEEARKTVRKHKKTERLVYVPESFPRSYTAVKANETDAEAIQRYRNKNRSLFKVKEKNEIPIKYRK